MAEAPAGIERGCKPAPAVMDLPDPSARKLRQARRGVFSVYGFRTRLEPPIDWAMDPHESARFQAYLSNWDFLDTLLGGYRRTGDPRLLRQAAEIALDWTAANPRGNPQGGEGTWSGKITGDRAPRLAYILRASRCPGVLRERERRVLNAALRDHIEILMGPESEGDTNHALYVQLGVAGVMRQLPGFPGAEEIVDEAAQRFERVLRDRLADGVWLEHSTSYQFLAIRVVERFLRWVGGRRPALRRDLRRMKRAAAWLTAPDGRHTLLGDSRMLTAPGDIRARAERQRGMAVFADAGLAVVREGGSHLVVAAGFHNTTHKHADELSFELAEAGRRVVSDTGMYHKDPGDIRDFVVSARAHNTLTVDGETFKVTSPGRAYGSALLATGTGDGWYAILARNPLLKKQDVRHQRLFLYRPGGALIVLDRAEGEGDHRFERFVHFAPAVRVRADGPHEYALAAPGIDGRLRHGAAGARTARGERDPLAGFMATDYREWRPRTSVELSDRGEELLDSFALSFDGSDTRLAGLRWRAGRITASLRTTGEREQRIDVHRRGDELVVRVGR